MSRRSGKCPLCLSTLLAWGTGLAWGGWCCFITIVQTVTHQAPKILPSWLEETTTGCLPCVDISSVKSPFFDLPIELALQVCLGPCWLR